MQRSFFRAQVMPATLLFIFFLKVNMTHIYLAKGVLFPFLNISPIPIHTPAMIF